MGGKTPVIFLTIFKTPNGRKNPTRNTDIAENGVAVESRFQLKAGSLMVHYLLVFSLGFHVEVNHINSGITQRWQSGLFEYFCWT